MATPDLDPKKDPKGAVAYIRATLEGFRQREGELALWYQTLAEEVAIGTVRCTSVVAYNRAALANFSFAQDFYGWLQPAMDWLKTQGVDILPAAELPYPKLIGTRFRVSGAKGARSFDPSVMCLPTGDFYPGTPKSQVQLLQVDCSTSSSGGTAFIYRPADTTAALPGGQTAKTKGGALVYSPYGTIESLRSPAGFGDVLPLCFSPLGAIICLGLGILVGYLADQAVIALKVITGTERDEINAHLYDKKTEQDRKREQFWNECMKTKLGIKPSASIDAATMKQYADDCQATALKVYPDVTPPYASSWLAGLTGIAVVGGLIAVGVIAFRRRQRAAED